MGVNSLPKTATGTHVPYGITQCYLPSGRGDIPAFTPAEAGTRFSDPRGIQGWVDLVARYIPRWYTRPKTVTHPNTNRARRGLTSFMRRTPLTTTPRRRVGGVLISVTWAVSTLVDKPQKSVVTHGQCKARPTVTFPAAGHHRRLNSTRLFCSVTEARVCEQPAQGCCLKAQRPEKGKACWNCCDRTAHSSSVAAIWTGLYSKTYLIPALSLEYRAVDAEALLTENRNGSLVNITCAATDNTNKRALSYCTGTARCLKRRTRCVR